ncbi:MAG: hypothetical protein RQ847_04440 [Wenzhouxiangellaceae bacterium]|nr:hypothetical protein [Wenzhouxiangellaceae bacterium]
MKRLRQTKDPKIPDLDRRRMLGGVIGVGTAASLGLLSTAGNAPAREKPRSEARDRNYRETEHIRQYYEKARI